MSTTFSDSGPIPAVTDAVAPIAVTAPPAPRSAPAARPRRPRRLPALAVRTSLPSTSSAWSSWCSWWACTRWPSAAGRSPWSLGAFTTVFHTSRELFFLLTTLVLTYNYGRRGQPRWLRFWRRRYWLIVPAYVAWSAVYYAADGPGRGALPGAFWHDLLHASARYHLYFLLVTMQVYALFPVLRWVLRKTAGHHVALFAAVCVYQLALTAALQHYPVRSGPVAGWLNAAGSGIWLESYLLYVVGGALAGWHFERICEFTRRYARASTVALVAGFGAAAGIGTYLAEIYLGGATPGAASAVFQPVVAVEALAFGWALLAGGLLWSDRGAPHRKFFAAGSASSFGIYLAHPLVLQGLLAVASASGVLAAVRGAPAGLEVLALLGVAVPLIYGVSWMIASGARRTPLSLMLTGREYAPVRRRASSSTGKR